MAPIRKTLRELFGRSDDHPAHVGLGQAQAAPAAPAADPSPGGESLGVLDDPSPLHADDAERTDDTSRPEPAPVTRPDEPGERDLPAADEHPTAGDPAPRLAEAPASLLPGPVDPTERIELYVPSDEVLRDVADDAAHHAEHGTGAGHDSTPEAGHDAARDGGAPTPAGPGDERSDGPGTDGTTPPGASSLGAGAPAPQVPAPDPAVMQVAADADSPAGAGAADAAADDVASGAAVDPAVTQVLATTAPQTTTPAASPVPADAAPTAPATTPAPAPADAAPDAAHDVTPDTEHDRRPEPTTTRGREPMQTAEIRRRWLEFFQGKGHTVVPSAPLLYDDPNLLFVNAGMVPFKPYFLGAETPPFRRATSVQKCVRTGDIEEVGKTTRHGTFFQMNGNFSFGDYFKKDAIELAWELVTTPQADGGLGFDPETVWVTYLGPGHHPDYPEGDKEAHDIWRSVGVPEERIQGRGLKDNYWHMGVEGPGGPCSEIYIDRGPQYGADGGPEADEDRFLEIWNLVFQTEYITDVKAKDDFRVVEPLPAKNIDTGMGLERVAYLLQGVDNLYEIDEVYPVIEAAEKLSGRTYGANDGDDVRFRVVADHVRSSLMLIGDGVTPGNEGRGYVLRRLLRRAVRSMRLLGVTEPVLPTLLPVSKDRMKASYPELETDFARISQIAYAEEEAFRRTLTAGTTILDTAVAEAKAAGGTALAGDKAFALHDTYGFPIDLTLEMAAEQGLDVDVAGFRRLMGEQRDRAKADAKAKKQGHGDMSVWRELRDLGETDWRAYTELDTEGSVVGLVRDGARVPELEPGQTGQVVLDRTSFYAESGGQIADEGVIVADGSRLKVLDVQRPVKGLVVHTVEVLDGPIREGASTLAQVDPEWRRSACQAHSGTHVVHAALRQVLGPSALQSGSYNKPGYLRLDFAWNQALSAETRSEVEEAANLALRADLPVSASWMTLPEARELGALALFGETYGEQVRVVEIGGPWSRELCGGTHVLHSSQVGALTFTGESSVGSGVRRIEAFVGMEALRFLARERALVAELSGMVNVQPAELPERISSVLTRLKDAEREIQTMRRQQVLAAAQGLVDSRKDVFGATFVAHQAPDGTSPDDLRTLVLDVRSRLGDDRPVTVAAATVAKDRPVVIVATNAAAREWGIKAGALVRLAAQTLGGGGGGKDDLAQGGGQDAAKIGEALTAVEYEVGHCATAH